MTRLFARTWSADPSAIFAALKHYPRTLGVILQPRNFQIAETIATTLGRDVIIDLPESDMAAMHFIDEITEKGPDFVERVAYVIVGPNEPNGNWTPGSGTGSKDPIGPLDLVNRFGPQLTYANMAGLRVALAQFRTVGSWWDTIVHSHKFDMSYYVDVEKVLDFPFPVLLATGTEFVAPSLSRWPTQIVEYIPRNTLLQWWLSRWRGNTLETWAEPLTVTTDLYRAAARAFVTLDGSLTAVRRGGRNSKPDPRWGLTNVDGTRLTRTGKEVLRYLTSRKTNY